MPPRGPAVSVRRKRKPSEFHSEVTRERIRAGVIIDRFQKHFMGELDLTPRRSASAKSCYARSFPT